LDGDDRIQVVEIEVRNMDSIGKISENAKCRECKHRKGDHTCYSYGGKEVCWGDEGGCECLEFEIQIEDKVYAAARRLQEELNGLG
jgi:hypothetical protein